VNGIQKASRFKALGLVCSMVFCLYSARDKAAMAFIRSKTCSSYILNRRGGKASAI
jgi:hypothetical protein